MFYLQLIYYFLPQIEIFVENISNNQNLAENSEEKLENQVYSEFSKGKPNLPTHYNYRCYEHFSLYIL